MSSLLAKLSSLFGRPVDEQPLLQDLDAGTPSRSPITGGLFRPFTRRDAASNLDQTLSALADSQLRMTESIERLVGKQDETTTYLRHLPKAMETMPENMKQLGEALAAVRQHLENQGTQGRQMNTILEKVGQAAVDQRRILDAVRQRLDMSAEHDAKVSEHFNNFANAITTSNDTTRMAGEVLKSLEDNIRQRDEALERIIRKHQGRHTILLAAAVVLSAAALLAATVGIYVTQRGG